MLGTLWNTFSDVSAVPLWRRGGETWRNPKGKGETEVIGPTQGRHMNKGCGYQHIFYNDTSTSDVSSWGVGVGELCQFGARGGGYAA